MKSIIPKINAVAIVLLCVFYSVKWLNTNLYFDFPAFYTAGRLLREHKNPYDLTAQCELQHKLTPFPGCMPFAHPPLLLPLMALSAVDSLYVARSVYGSFIWLLFVACLWPLKRLTGSWVKSAALLAFMPVLQALQSTQSTALVLFSILMWAVLLQDKRDFWAGLILSLALVKPHIAVALAVPLALVRWKAFLGFACGSLVIGLYSLALVGPTGIQGMLSIMRLMSNTEGYYVGRSSMYNLAGFLARSDFDTRFMWPAYGLAVAGIAALWRRFGTDISMLGVAVVIALFFAPHLHLHDLSLLILPMVLFPYWFPLIVSALMVLCFQTPLLHPYGYALFLCVVLGCVRERLINERSLAPGQECRSCDASFAELPDESSA